MDKKEIEVILQRIEKWYKSLYEMVVYDKRVFNAEFGWTKDHISFEDKNSLSYKPIKEGENWGEKWETAWFHLKSDIPKSFEGKNKITQHKMVYDSLKGKMGNELHALMLKTKME